jgi:stage II sporulation protein R
MKKRAIAPIMLLGLALWFSTGVLTVRAQTALSGKLLRLHVVAVSDSETDQANKLQVRDRVLAAAARYTAGAETAAEAAAALAPHLGELRSEAEACLASLGADEAVTVTLAREEFSTREYDTFSLPAGQYETLRVVIGAGEGHNWWCVVFPSLCTAATAGEFDQAAVSAGLTQSEVGWITDDSADVRVRFRILELLQKLFS